MINYANKNISVIFFKYGLVKISTLESDFLCTLDNFYNCVITNGAEGFFAVKKVDNSAQATTFLLEDKQCLKFFNANLNILDCLRGDFNFINYLEDKKVIKLINSLSKLNFYDKIYELLSFNLDIDYSKLLLKKEFFDYLELKYIDVCKLHPNFLKTYTYKLTNSFNFERIIKLLDEDSLEYAESLRKTVDFPNSTTVYYLLKNITKYRDLIIKSIIKNPYVIKFIPKEYLNLKFITELVENGLTVPFLPRSYFTEKNLINFLKINKRFLKGLKKIYPKLESYNLNKCLTKKLLKNFIRLDLSNLFELPAELRSLELLDVLSKDHPLRFLVNNDIKILDKFLNRISPFEKSHVDLYFALFGIPYKHFTKLENGLYISSGFGKEISPSPTLSDSDLEYLLNKKSVNQQVCWFIQRKKTPDSFKSFIEKIYKSEIKIDSLDLMHFNPFDWEFFENACDLNYIKVYYDSYKGLFAVEDTKHKIQFNFRFIELLSRVENCSLDFKTFFISEWLSVYTTYTHTIGYHFSTHYYEPLLEFIEELWQSNTEFDIMDLKNIEDVYDYFL